MRKDWGRQKDGEPGAARRVRLDALLHLRGLATSRERAKAVILAGHVLVNGVVVDRPDALVADAAKLEVSHGPPYVGRGGLKLAEALRAYCIQPNGWVCADVGASTGGFTDCLLQHGAKRVYAIDVGYGQLDWKLRQDSRVVVLERTNARYLRSLPEPVVFVTIDVSFISLRLILPAVRDWLATGGQVVALIKPQFEAGARYVGKGGVVRDPETHRRVLADVLGWAESNSWSIWGLRPSPIRGPKGNLEFLAWLGCEPRSGKLDLESVIECALAACPDSAAV